MAEKPSINDPLDCIPDPIEVRRRLGAVYRIARILRGLLRLSERRVTHERLSSQPPCAPDEASHHE